MGKRPTVIKVGEVEAFRRGAPRRFDLLDIAREMEQVRASAWAEAEAIVEAAKTEGDNIRRTAHEQGHRAGREQGFREGREAGRAEALEAARKEFAEQQKSLIESCQRLMTGINAGRVAWEAAARRDLIELAVAIARRVARHVGERDREAVLENLEEAVRLAGTRSEVSIVVSPLDAEAAREFARPLVEGREQCRHVRVVEDAAVSPGGCLIQWSGGAVDARLETQLDRIEAALVEGAAPSDDRPGGLPE